MKDEFDWAAVRLRVGDAMFERGWSSIRAAKETGVSRGTIDNLVKWGRDTQDRRLSLISIGFGWKRDGLHRLGRGEITPDELPLVVEETMPPATGSAREA